VIFVARDLQRLLLISLMLQEFRDSCMIGDWNLRERFLSTVEVLVDDARLVGDQGFGQRVRNDVQLLVEEEAGEEERFECYALDGGNMLLN
jgi:hypothetical protein